MRHVVSRLFRNPKSAIRNRMHFRPHITAMTGYVPGEQPRGHEKVIKLNTNENPYPCSPKVKAAIGRVVTQGLQKYPDPLATGFRMAAGEVLGVDPDCILCGNGSDDLLTIVTRAFVGPGDVVRFPSPSYILYQTLAELQDASSDVVTFEPDWSLGFAFTQPLDRLRLAYLANPNSPSGTMIAPGEVAAIADSLPCPLVVDEAYVDFADCNCLDLVRSNERILVTRTLSKSYALAGLRFGYLVAQPHVVRELRKVKDSYNCDAISIVGATAAIEDQAWRHENRAAILKSRSVLTAGLRELGFNVVDSQANFVWATHPTKSHELIYQQLKMEGVLVRYMCYPGWGDGLRITVGTDAQIDAFLTLVKTAI
jgi:histidinol-phosphate aminotransferase